MRSGLIGLALAFASLATAASGAQFKPAPNQTFTLDLDTQAGNFSLWRADDISRLDALRADIAFVRWRDDPKWAPSFHIDLVNGPESVNFTVIADREKNRLYTTLETWRGGKQLAQELYVFGPVLGEKFSLDLNWAADGTVTAVVRDRAAQAMKGFERHVAKLGSAPTSLQIFNSTGEVKFDALQLGRTPP